MGASDGSVWFTDPGYGIMSDYEGRQAPFELPTAVYRLDPDDGRAEPVVQDLERPNGLCFAPDGSRLYVVDSGSTPRAIHVYESCANLCFGGPAGNRLFMAASRSIYALYVNATGA